MGTVYLRGRAFVGPSVAVDMCSTLFLIMEEKKEILQQPIQELPLGDAARQFLKENSFLTLEQLLEKPVSYLLKMPGMTTHILTDLVTFLESNNLASLLKHES